MSKYLLFCFGALFAIALVMTTASSAEAACYYCGNIYGGGSCIKDPKGVTDQCALDCSSGSGCGCYLQGMVCSTCCFVYDQMSPDGRAHLASIPNSEAPESLRLASMSWAEVDDSRMLRNCGGVLVAAEYGPVSLRRLSAATARMTL